MKKNLFWGSVTISIAILYLFPLISILHTLVKRGSLTLFHLILIYAFLGAPIMIRLLVGLQIMRQTAYVKQLLLLMFWSEFTSVSFLMIISGRIAFVTSVSSNIFIMFLITILLFYYLFITLYFKKSSK